MSELLRRANHQHHMTSTNQTIQHARQATQLIQELLDIRKKEEARIQQRHADRRYFMRLMLFPRLYSDAFHHRRPAQRKKEVQRLERLYFLIQ